MDQKTIEQIKAAKSAKEIAETARKENITLSDNQAEALDKQYHAKEGELSDQELNNVAGGACSSAETLRKEGKYMEVSEDYVCYAFEWPMASTAKKVRKCAASIATTPCAPSIVRKAGCRTLATSSSAALISANITLSNK